LGALTGNKGEYVAGQCADVSGRGDYPVERAARALQGSPKLSFNGILLGTVPPPAARVLATGDDDLASDQRDFSSPPDV